MICSTDSPRPILTLGAARAALESRRGRLLVLIDIAVPRDVEPGIRHLPGVILTDIDDLARVAQANLSSRLREARRAEQLVEQELRRSASRARPGRLPPEQRLPGRAA